MKTTLFLLAAFSVSGLVLADHHGKKKPPANSNERARPDIISPGTASTNEQPGKPPSDAIILFDGRNLDNFEHKGGKAPQWKVENGYTEVTRTGQIISKQSFSDAQIHIEWATPSEIKGKGQRRGNSGVILGSYGEVQVLDSYENDTYPGGQAGALYGKSPPLVNASRKPGVWQSYDIIFHTAKGDKPAHVTVLHNGVVVHHRYELSGATDGISREVPWRTLSKYTPHDPGVFIGLQDHGNPVRYRNIWIRPIGQYDKE